MTVHDDARALEWVSSEYMLRWLRRLPGTTLTDFGDACGACTPGRPDLDFLNTVHRLLPGDAGLVPRIAEHYREAGVRAWLELMPAPGFEALAEALRAAGAGQEGFLVVLERDLPGPPEPPDLPEPAAITVEALDGDVEDFVRVLPRGHGLEGAVLEAAIPITRHQARVEEARQYLARVDGAPAAAAVLFPVDGIGHLANASTLPGFRRRGCQSALIRRRLADAAAAGCRRAAVITTWASQSHANLARAGFRTAYTKAVWRLGPP